MTLLSESYLHCDNRINEPVSLAIYAYLMSESVKEIQSLGAIAARSLHSGQIS